MLKKNVENNVAEHWIKQNTLYLNKYHTTQILCATLQRSFTDYFSLICVCFLWVLHAYTVKFDGDYELSVNRKAGWILCICIALELTDDQSSLWHWLGESVENGLWWMICRGMFVFYILLVDFLADHMTDSVSTKHQHALCCFCWILVLLLCPSPPTCALCAGHQNTMQTGKVNFMVRNIPNCWITAYRTLHNHESHLPVSIDQPKKGNYFAIISGQTFQLVFVQGSSLQ